MNKVISIAFFLIVISFFPQVYAQTQLGLPPEAQEVEINISENGKVHVEHFVKPSDTSVVIELINGTSSNLEIKSITGEEAQHMLSSLDKVVVTIFPSTQVTKIEYDLEDALLLIDGMWTWDYVYLAPTSFIFPESVELVFVNDRPVPKGEVKGIKCHGCDAYIEYLIDLPITQHQVQWEDRTFQVEFITLTEIQSFSFDQPTRKISFDVNEEDQLITLGIPLELLWNPYDVFLEDQQILKHEFLTNGTHLWLNFRPQTAGHVEIIGTSVIPEFTIFSPLVVGLGIVLLIQFRNKFSLP